MKFIQYIVVMSTTNGKTAIVGEAPHGLESVSPSFEMTPSSRDFLTETRTSRLRSRSSSGRRGSQVQPLHARQENDYNKYFVNDPHLIKEGVHIPINSTCCGKNVTGAKVKIFHKLESHLVRRAVVILLCIDVVCVFFEIIFYKF